MDRIGQVAITVNGECCPAQDSQSPNFRVRQITFGVAGIGSGAPGFVECQDVNDVYAEAIAWLEKMKLKANIAVVEPDVVGPERSGAFKPDA